VLHASSQRPPTIRPQYVPSKSRPNELDLLCVSEESLKRFNENVDNDIRCQDLRSSVECGLKQSAIIEHSRTSRATFPLPSVKYMYIQRRRVDAVVTWDAEFLFFFVGLLTPNPGPASLLTLLVGSFDP